MRIVELIKPGHSVALTSPLGGALTFAALRNQVHYTVDFLKRIGLGRGECVALSLGNGPQMAAALLAFSETGVVAPLNPNYREQELRFYLQDLRARAVVVEANTKSPVITVAQECNLPVLTLSTAPGSSGHSFTLESAGPFLPSANEEPAYSVDTALALHTSGTTARPKLVALSHDALCQSAQNIICSLRLQPHDVCLNMMPLFHVHGLVAGILASMGAGATTCCAPEFNAHGFLSWLNTSGATWYTAVPTMHQTILARVKRNAPETIHHHLRFIRSSSAPLAQSVWTELENFFSVPLLNAYGMTEAAHQISSIPLPPGQRKLGTVGVSTGPRIAIADETGRHLEPGCSGEVVLRGETVTRGYKHPTEANSAAFYGDWFRTGDQGVMDHEGYLTLTGRLKELINCGGEKISPYEVEEILLQHQAVSEAVSFAIPHVHLGEVVGAAVVLNEDSGVSEPVLRSFLSERLVRFKVPRRVLVLDALPKGPTGKLQRIGLAQALGLSP